METLILQAFKNNKVCFENLNLCANIIKNGGIGAFPTETVYGLGANAFNDEAIKKIYKAKVRPTDNPLIFHISNFSMIDKLIDNINENSKKLIDNFWPGPLTLIFNKKSNVSKIASAGLNTIAIRFPENEIANAFIEACNTPIVAPSANISGKPSPTRFSHVQFDLNNKIDFIIDGGVCKYGLESTVVDCTTKTPVLLRPGAITINMLKNVLDNIKIDDNILYGTLNKIKSPGMKYTHYSPVAQIFIVEGKNKYETILSLSKKYKDKKIGVLTIVENKKLYDKHNFIVQTINKNDFDKSDLYHTLRKFDFFEVDIIFAESFVEFDSLAIMNRLKKASSYKIINCD